MKKKLYLNLSLLWDMKLIQENALKMSFSSDAQDLPYIVKLESNVLF